MLLRLFASFVIVTTGFLAGCTQSSQNSSNQGTDQELSPEEERLRRIKRNPNVVEIDSEKRMSFLRHSYVVYKGWYWHRPQMGGSNNQLRNRFDVPQKMSVTIELSGIPKGFKSFDDLFEKQITRYQEAEEGKVENLTLGKYRAIKLSPGKTPRLPYVYLIKLDSQNAIKISYSNTPFGSLKWEVTESDIASLDQDIQKLIKTLEFETKFIPGQNAPTLRK